MRRKKKKQKNNITDRKFREVNLGRKHESIFVSLATMKANYYDSQIYSKLYILLAVRFVSAMYNVTTNTPLQITDCR